MFVYCDYYYLELQWGLLVASGQAEGIDREDFTRWLVLCEAARPFGEYVRGLPRAERVDFIQDAARLAREEVSDEEAQVLGERYKQWRDDRRFDRLWSVLKQSDFAFEIAPDVLDRFIFLSAPPVEAVERAEAEPARPRRAVPPREAKALREEIRGPEGLLPDTVLVPAGPFLMVSTEDDELASDDERPQHTVELPAYRLGRYPLTNAEYARRWPWGDDFNPVRANTGEGGLGNTTPVGKYSPAGDSPYGAADMAGNVWAWCSSLSRDYPYDPADGREDLGAEGSRVRRGGSWYLDEHYARCAFRTHDLPYGRFDYYGCRVCVAAPHS